jgi:hypothetical protein
MGAECSSDCGNAQLVQQVPEDSTINASTISDHREFVTMNSFDFKSYKQYNVTTDLLKKRILDIIKKVEVVNDFALAKT